MRRLVPSLAIGLLLLTAGCAGGERSNDSKQATGDSSSAAGAVCAAQRELAEARESALVNLTRDELREGVARRVGLLEDIADGTRDGETAAEAKRLAELERTVGDRLVAAWSENSGRDLKAQATEAGIFRVEDYVLRDRQRSLDDLRDLRQRVLSNVAVECGDLQPLPTDLPVGAEQPPGGSILYADLRAGDLARVRTDGHRLPPVVAGGSHKKVAMSPPGNRLAFVAETADTATLIVAAPDGSEQKAVAEPAACFSWSPDGHRLAVASYVPQPSLRLVEASTGVATPVQGEVGCPSFLDADTLLIEEGRPDEGWSVISRARLDGSDRHTLVQLDGCNLLHPRVSPDGKSIAMLASCPHIRRTGLYVAPAPGGTPTQIIAGNIGVFTWSPDSRWLCFAYVRPGDDSRHAVALYLARADGTNAHELVKDGSFPAWGT